MNYQIVVMSMAGMLAKTRLAPMCNINVSNVPGPNDNYYLRGAKLVQSIPVSVLAGNAVNITFGSMADRMDYAVLTDATVIPEAQKITDLIAVAFAELRQAFP